VLNAFEVLDVSQVLTCVDLRIFTGVKIIEDLKECLYMKLISANIYLFTNSN
jgi:hypothetical protein